MEITQYEYNKLGNDTSLSELNKMGKEGWDITYTRTEHGGSYFCKRPCGTIEITPKYEQTQQQSYNPYER